MSDIQFSRRDFIKLTAVGVAAVAGTHLVKEAQASSSTPAGKHQWVMVIDQSKCTGCNYCTLACQAHNDTAPENHWNVVSEAGEVDGHKVFISRPCMQCAKAPCVEVCMVRASYYRDDGIVMMDYDRSLSGTRLQLGKIRGQEPGRAGVGLT
jgi:ferredoxin